MQKKLVKSGVSAALSTENVKHADPSADALAYGLRQALYDQDVVIIDKREDKVIGQRAVQESVGFDEP